jgi:eukaryotic-like serine/threonine-protein kinase
VDAERYARVKALFSAVCDLAEPERSARLAASGAGPEVIAKVRALLVQEQVVTTGFAAPIVGLLGGLGSENLQPGATLGAWTLVRRIGEGGMGTVYQAQRSDGHFEQIGAIKVLRGLPSATAMQYLARERQILAGLTHPHIARLLDGGATPAGQPYLVMEYLDGVAIDRYCRDRQLDTSAILKLLLTVCDAVSFAHQRLIVHCDLKPSNILVDAQGRPSLLDFGIARLLDAELPDGGPSSASLRARAFTPGFASPEQENGEALTTAADIYSLGRLLEALIGATRLAADTELAAMVTRATRQLPADRYASAELLAQDLTRYLNRQPLAALPATIGYRSRKMLQRRWPVVVAVVLFALTVVMFTWRLAVDRDRALTAEQQALADRDRAQQAQAASKQISDFLVSMLDGANPDAGTGEIPTSKLVEQALTRIDTELAGQPAVQAELYGALAGVQDVLGNPKLAQSSFEKAIALERGLDRPEELARLLQELALLLRRSASKDDAAAPARESLTLFEAHAPSGSPQLVSATRTLGAILSQVSGKAEEAESLLRKALMRAEAIDPAGLEVVRTQAELAGHLTRAGALPEAERLLRRGIGLAEVHADGAMDALGMKEQLGAVLGKQRRFEEAEALLRAALAQRRALQGDDDVNIPWRLSELANVLTNGGKTLQALPIYREALNVAAPKMGVNSVPYAILLNNLAIASMRVGDYAGSERAFRQALEIVSGPWGEGDQGLANMRFNLGTLLSKTDPEQALPLVGACEAVFAKAYSADNPDVVDARMLLAVISAKLGHTQQARDWLRKVDDAQAELQPLNRADRAYAQALIEIDEGRTEAALASLQHAEELRTDALGEHDSRVWLAKIDRAELLAKRAGVDDRKASAELARDIFAHLDATLVSDSAVRARIARLL